MKTKFTFHLFLKVVSSLRLQADYFTKSYKLKASSGFTIIETLVAVAVLLISLVAPLTIAERGLASAEAARSEITAFYLAQEAVEYIRNVRDTNALAGRGAGANPQWLQGLNSCVNANCGVDTTAPPGLQVVSCSSSNSNCLLYQYIGQSTSDTLFGVFGHRSSSNWKATNMTRTVRLREVQSKVEAEVLVTITWRAGSLGSRTLTVKENIFNWFDAP